jgi:hypothetical protein
VPKFGILITILNRIVFKHLFVSGFQALDANSQGLRMIACEKKKQILTCTVEKMLPERSTIFWKICK